MHTNPDQEANAMSPDPPESSEFETLRREHKEIDREVQAFEELRLRDWQTRPNAVEVLQARLESFRDRLQVHFAHEELGGFFEQLIEVSPQRVREVTRLEEQHGEFRARLAVVAEALFADVDGSTLPEVIFRLHRFAESFRKHEDAENRLLAESLNDDMGSPD